MTVGMWIAAAVVGWCGAAVAVAFLVAAVIRLRDQQVPNNNVSIEELLMSGDQNVSRPVGGTGVGGTSPKPPSPPAPPKPPAVTR